MRAIPWVFAILLLSTPAHATDVSTSQSAAPDRQGGVYRLVSDARGLWVWHLRGDGFPTVGYSIAQLVDSTHSPSWGAIEADGFGGAVISYRVTTPPLNGIRTMRIAPWIAPAPGWALHGDLAANTLVGPGYHGMTPDFAGGLYSAWQDFRTDFNDQNIVMQSMTSTATPATGWPADGLFVCDAPGDQYDPVLTADPAGGAFAVWYDARAVGTNEDTGFDIWAQSISYTGVMRWADNGVPVTRRSGHQTSARAVGDGLGGILVVWVESSQPLGSPGDARLGVQRLTSTGHVASGWPLDGLLVGDAALSTVRTTRPSLVSDGRGGAYVLWADMPPGTGPQLGPTTLRAQHVTATGAIAPGWPLTGTVLATSSALILPNGLVPDGQDGVIACWSELEGNTNHLIAQRLSFTGATASGWPSTGILVTDQNEGLIGDPVMVEDHEGGATFSWSDTSSDPGFSVRPRVRRITHEGVLDPYWGGYPFVDGQPTVSPTPSPGAVSITFALPTLSSVEIRVFDLSGRRVRDLGEIASVAAGRHQLRWDGRDDSGASLPAGLYFMRIRWSERDHTARVVIAR